MIGIGRAVSQPQKGFAQNSVQTPFIFCGNGIVPVIKRQIDINASGVQFIFVLKKKLRDPTTN
jgi:hypothetical protein